MNTTKAKVDADLLDLALSSFKQLKIQKKYTLSTYKCHFTCKYKLSLHTPGNDIY